MIIGILSLIALLTHNIDGLIFLFLMMMALIEIGTEIIVISDKI